MLYVYFLVIFRKRQTNERARATSHIDMRQVQTDDNEALKLTVRSKVVSRTGHRVI